MIDFGKIIVNTSVLLSKKKNGANFWFAPFPNSSMEGYFEVLLLG